ncbi:MAG: Fic family protein [Verrucomicrobiales bacterium]|nr:Fic family protein [Verrucomicrobiales bacterium]
MNEKNFTANAFIKSLTTFLNVYFIAEMNAALFGEKRTGELVPIVTPTGTDYAFVPNKLPPNWELPDRLWPMVVEARTALSKLDGIGQTLPDQELLLEPLKKREAITSSRIEGTYATAQELMLFELSQKVARSANDPANSWREVHNYRRTLGHGIGQLQTLPFCSRLFRDLHSMLMSGVHGHQARPGQWRDHQVAIGSDRRFVPPPVSQMLQALDDLERFINDSAKYDPLVRAYIVHYQFEAIHPFADGNGRIGRVLLSLMIARWCNLSAPWLYMSPFYEKFRDEYVSKMFDISSNGDWETWIEFCLRGTIQQSNDAISKCERLSRLRTNFLDRMQSSGSSRTDRMINDLFKNPIVRVSILRRKYAVTYPTAQADVDKLVNANILRLLENVHPKAYYAPEIFGLAYPEGS